MKRILTGVAMVVLAGCATPGKENVERGRQLEQLGPMDKTAGLPGNAATTKQDTTASPGAPESTRKETAQLLQRAIAQLSRNQLYNAYLSMMAGVEASPDFLNGGNALEVKRQLLSRMAAKSQQYEAAGLLGNAFHWQELALKLGGADHTSSQRLQTLKDQLRQRVVKKIDVVDFLPPANSTDAGTLVTSQLLSYMSRNAGSDIKIRARDMLGTSIKEIKFGPTGLYDIENVKKIGTLNGTDIFIFGTVAQYNVEKSAEESTKTATVVVAKKRVSNPAYQSWLQHNPTANGRELAMAPPALIDEDIRETVSYKVGTHRKTAHVDISFKMIDVVSGELLISTTIKSRKEAKDDFSEAVEAAHIPFDPLQLPPDADLLEKAAEEGIADLGHLVLSRFQNLQTVYLNAAELLSKQGQPEQAVERYIDAMVSEEVKNVSSQVTEQARREISRQLQLADGI